MEKRSAQSGLHDRPWHQFIGVGLACALLAPVSTSATVFDTLGNTTAVKRDSVDLVTYPSYAGRAWTKRVVDLGGPSSVTLETTADRTELSRRIAQLSTLGKLGGATSWSETFDYVRDDAGNPLVVDRSQQAGDHPLAAHTVDYKYDTLHRVSDVGPDPAVSFDYGNAGTATESISLDLLGNRTAYTGRDGVTTTYTHDDANAYETITPGDNVPVHDVNGNLTANERGFGFAYDYENRLSTIYEDADANGTLDGGEPILATYTYDALGRRTSETRTDAVANSTTLYIYDGPRIIAEYDGGPNNPLLRYYVHGETYVDEQAIVHEASSGKDFAYSLDDMYNVIGLVDADGELVAGYIYDAYGLPQYRPLLIGIRNNLQTTVPQGDPLEHLDLDDSGFIDLVDLALAAEALNDLPNPALGSYAFQGRRLSIYETASGASLPIYDFRARAYDPILGRFMQHDPAEYIDSYNLYLCLGGNPLYYLDPTGKEYTIPGLGATMSGIATLVGQILTSTLYAGAGTLGAYLTINLAINLFHNYIIDYAIAGADAMIAGEFNRSAALFAAGTVLATFMSKQAGAVKDASEKLPQIMSHITRIMTAPPGGPDENGWKRELRAWANAILRFSKRMKGKTRDKWSDFAQDLLEWLNAPGNGPPPAAPV
jgi:RHS repeat-associated protein